MPHLLFSPRPATRARGALLALLAAASPLVASPPRGYIPRDCGFDTNRNGVRGEAADCRICDGVTADPDDDGVAEEIFYVDCDGGANTPTCGAPGAPCATVGYALGTRADGPADGVEEIVCFRGTCTDVELLSPDAGGVPGTYLVPATGSQARDWLYPSDPLRIVGWDTGGDHRYPPLDADDVAILDGAGGRTRAFRVDAQDSYLELAHFTARDYGRFTTNDNSGLLRFGSTAGGADHVVVHDLHLERINQDRAVQSAVLVFHLFGGSTRPRWFEASNLLVTDNGGWFGRGELSATGLEGGPLRFQNVSRTVHGCDFSLCGAADSGSIAFRIWGYYTGIEILDSVWDANVAAWEPNLSGGPPGAQFASVAQCSRDWTIRNNLILDHKQVLEVQASSDGFCEGEAARPVDGVVIDGNVAINRFEGWVNGDLGIQLRAGGDSAGETIGEVKITDNILASAAGWEAGIWIRNQHATLPTGTQVTIAHNTLIGPFHRFGAITIGDPGVPTPPFRTEQIALSGNLVAGLAEGEPNAIATYAPAALASDENVFDPVGGFGWLGADLAGLTEWRAATDLDGSSNACAPQFVDAAAADYHLGPLDSCAIGEVTSTALPTLVRDVDGDERPAESAWDAGADHRTPRIFVDGFETGTTAAWSAATA